MTGWMRVLAAAALAWGVAGAAEEAPPQPSLTAIVDQAIASAAAEAAGDPAKVLDLVRGRIFTESYDGVLKGPRGTWLTRAGNSADQAMLVSELLGSRSKRFAWCTLAAPPELPAAPPFVSLFADPARATEGLSDPAAREAIEALARLRQARLDQSASLKADIAGALTTAGVQVSPAPAPTGQQHVWVQVEADGTWTDLDPTTPNSAPPCAAAETAATLPDAMEVRLRLAVQVESTPGEGPAEAEAMSLSVPLFTVSAARIAFGFAETIEVPEGRKPDENGMYTYTPVILIDGERTQGAPLMLPAPSAALGNAVAGVGDIFDEAPPAPEAEVLAVSLEVTLSGPGMNDKPLRSEIFDRLGPAARAEGYDASKVQALAVANGEYAALSALWQIAVLTGIADPALTVGLLPDTATSEGLSAMLDQWLRIYPAIKRDLGGQPAYPMVLLAGLTAVDRDDGDIGTRLVVDALQVPARPADAEAAVADAALTVAAEKLLAELVSDEAPPLSDAAQVFDAARANAIPVIALRPGEAIDAMAGASPDALARAAQRLKDGYTILTPQFPPSADGVMATAWWTVDPSGLIRDEHENGRHTSAGEEGSNLCRAATWSARFRLFRSKIVTVVTMAAALTFADGNAAAGKAILQNAIKIVEADDKTKKAGELARKISCAK